MMRTAWSNGHSDNILPIFSKPLGILDTEGKKIIIMIIIIIVMSTSCTSLLMPINITHDK